MYHFEVAFATFTALKMFIPGAGTKKIYKRKVLEG